MVISRLFCRNPNQFPQYLEQLNKVQDQKTFILFTGTKNESSGRSWCGDCVRAEPIIENALSELKESATILICDVDREPYRTSTYMYRTNPMINLRCVPTLMKWEGGKCTMRLNDSQCQNAAAVSELLDS